MVLENWVMTSEQSAGGDLSRREVWRMFDRIAGRYDLLNRSLSFGRDVAWRRRMARCLTGRHGLRLLDLATGTGDQIFHLLDAGAPIATALGLDMSEGMLAQGRVKLARRSDGCPVVLQRGDATAIPSADGVFDCVTISFGIRNVEDVDLGLREMYRVLAPGGRALILEFSRPARAIVRGPYLFYFRHILPRIGSWVSGDGQAYRYLNRTVEAFPSGEAFCVLMRRAGFSAVRALPLTFGVATIYQGDRVL